MRIACLLVMTTLTRKYLRILSYSRMSLVPWQTSLEAERVSAIAAREDLAATSERLRRSQDEDLASALSDLATSREKSSTLAAEKDDLVARLSAELDARRVAEDLATDSRKQAADARNAVAGLREAARVREVKAAEDIETAIGVAEAAEAETAAAGRELEAVRLSLAEAVTGREAAEEMVRDARGEIRDMKDDLRRMEEEVGKGVGDVRSRVLRAGGFRLLVGAVFVGSPSGNFGVCSHVLYFDLAPNVSIPLHHVVFRGRSHVCFTFAGPSILLSFGSRVACSESHIRFILPPKYRTNNL